MDKLTLNIDREIIRKAKGLASERQTSVSEMFSNFIVALSAKDTQRPSKLSPLTKKASGIAKIEGDIDYKQELSKAFAEKYGYGK